MACAILLCGSIAFSEETEPNDAENFSRLLLDKPSIPVTLPRDFKPKAEALEFPPEGSMLLDKRCRLVREAGSEWFVLEYVDEPQPARHLQRRLLPSRLLEKMEEFTGKDSQAVFTIRGETTVYNKRCYMLLRSLTAENPERFELPEEPEPEKKQPETTPVTSASQTPQQPASASADDIVSRLMTDRLGKPITHTLDPPKGSSKAEPSVAPVPDNDFSPTYNNMVVDRLGYVVRDERGEWWQVRFDADNTLREPPVRLLPCEKLETKIEKLISDSKGNIVKLRVTGEITYYKGRRYMLIRKALRERDMGQF